VAWHGARACAGLTVRKNSSAAAPARAVERVLHDPSFRAAAQRLAADIAAETATDGVVEELEALAGRAVEA
jgi:UDP:flavonoid glycosyltransferase YjiC (YdhE family)